MDISDAMAKFWDADAAGYDRVPDHGVRSAAERAAWDAALVAQLPPAPARVLDVGAGTGFLSVAAAQLGHRVTAIDLSEGMLSRLRSSAAAADVEVTVLQAAAEAPPEGPFDAIMERHVLWTLPDPGAALAGWRGVAPAGRLLSFGGLWGDSDPLETAKRQLRGMVGRLLGEPGHHAEYPPEVRAQLPLAGGSSPDAVSGLVRQAGWGPPRLHRLRDVEWARLQAAWPLERLLGTTPQYLIVAG